MPDTSSPAGHTTGARTDLGRRVRARREELGLSHAEVARRTGSAPGYVEYLEEHTSAPGTGFLLRLAEALETTPADLTGLTAELPPGIGVSGHSAEVEELGARESWALLAGHGVGRVVVNTESVPFVVPVNYTSAGESLAYRTAPGSVTAAIAGHEAAIEIDRIDDAFSEGWSVLVIGFARAVTDAAEIRSLERLVRSAPWAGSEDDLWIALAPTRITGRRIRAPEGR